MSKQFSKHGIARRGVRVVLNSSIEIEKSREGFRQFRSIRGDETTIRAIDPQTQLIRRETISSPMGKVVIDQDWKPASKGGGYIRTKTVIQDTDNSIRNSKNSTGRSSQTIIEYSNIKIGGVSIE